MKKLGIIALGMALGGCATLPPVSQLQTDCEAKTKTFPEMTECLKQAVATEQQKAKGAKLVANRASMLNQPTTLKLYLLKAEQLSERVQKHEISDLDARVELQQIYADIQHQFAMESAAAAGANAAQDAANAANRPRTTTCNDFGFGVHCTTY